jgi:hypothetical protein
MWKSTFLNQLSTSRSLQDFLRSAFQRGLPFIALLIVYPGFSVLQFRHHRFLRHRQDIGFFFGFSAIIAFKGIGQDIGILFGFLPSSLFKA